MGAVGSTVYGHLKRFAYRYNAEFRSHKFLDKGKLPRAPRYPSNQKYDIEKKLKENPSLKKEFEELNKKDEQLNEYLKKVYLTSNKVKEVQSKRPLPVNTKTPIFLFNEPKVPNVGNITLTKFVQLLVDYKNDPKKWTVSALSSHYALNSKDVANLLVYFCLFRKEKFDFMRAEGVEQDQSKSEKVEFEVYKQLEQKPLKKIEQK